MTPAGARKNSPRITPALACRKKTKSRGNGFLGGLNGDRSENGDYIYGKRRLREIDRRIRFLTQRLEKIEVINPLLQKSN